jgi:hypothetical protein
MPALLPVGGFGFIKASNIAKPFFDVAGIVEPYQKLAIEQLIYNLCNFGLWDKIIALYPMVGGTALAHSFNLKNLVNNNLTFFGGWVHSKTGAKPNGVNAYADTYLAQNSREFQFGRDDVHMSYYLKTPSNDAETVMGVYDGSLNPNWLFPNNGGLSSISIGSKSIVAGGATVNSGLIVGSSKLDINSGIGMGNGVAYSIPQGVAIQNTPLTYAIGATNFAGGVQIRHTVAECGFASIGTGFENPSQLLLLNAIVNQFIQSKT